MFYFFFINDNFDPFSYYEKQFNQFYNSIVWILFCTEMRKSNDHDFKIPDFSDTKHFFLQFV